MNTQPEQLFNKKCQACSGFSQAINKEDALEFLKQLSAWDLDETGKIISRKLNFKNFKQTMFFINALAFVCEKDGHHADVNFGYNYVNISLTTHELKGLSENDFIIAAKIDGLLK